MTAITIHAGDSLVVEVPVGFDPGGAISGLVGATAVASCRNAGTSVSGSVSVAGDTITCSWPAGVLAVGNWRFQARVSISGQTQTVAEATIRVMPAN